MVRTALLAFLIACQSKDTPKQSPAHPPIDAAVEVDWVGCKAALIKAPTVAATRRAGFLLDACQPCGDWTPILHWTVLTKDGGPTRLAIENKMLACGYCEPNAKQRFLGNLDNARGGQSRAPWRALGEVCGARVGAVPDTRFMSAPYYALDHLARAAGARPDLAPLLDTIDIPLPAVSVTGSGFDLPVSSVSSPHAAPTQITITMTELRTGPLPHAKLSANGIVLAPGELYPGVLVDPAKLGTAIPAGPLTIIAPTALPASKIVEVADRTAGNHDLTLAVVGPGSPEGWVVPGTIPVALVPYVALSKPRTLELGESADPAIKDLKATPPGPGAIAIAVGPKATATTLAKLLGAIAFQGGKQAMLISAP